MVQAGEFLESLGNRKSEFVLLAISEYFVAHPEVLSTGNKLQIVVKPSYSRDQMEAIVRSIIEEKMAGAPLVAPDHERYGGVAATIEPDIDEMLKNLDLFE